MKVHYREDNIYDKIHRVVESSAQIVDTIELNYQEMEEFTFLIDKKERF